MKYSIYLFIALVIFGCQTVTEVPDPLLTYIWSGAPTTNSIVVKFKTAGKDEARIFLHRTSEFKDTVVASDWISTTNETYYTGGANFDGLRPDIVYYYSLQTKSGSASLSGKFRTLPSGPSSFKVAFGSCARTGSKHRVFSSINEKEPLFYMNIGDFHYENINQNCSYKFAEAYFDILGAPNQAELYSSRPFVYIWDDHDYGPNNSNADAICRREALEAYRMFIPHFPIALEGDKAPVSQSFTAGRIRFVLTDLRSHKIPPEYNGCELIERGTNFGPVEHMEWFKKELLTAKKNGLLVAWINPVPWISDPKSFDYDCDEKDTWSGYTEERRGIADFIKEHDINLFMLSGDAHMLAIDNGTNSDYATDKGAPIPVFHAAPLDNVGIIKGGPYSHGYSRKRGQFGMVEVTDMGGNEICITFTGYNSRGRVATNRDGQLLNYKFCRNVERP